MSFEFFSYSGVVVTATELATIVTKDNKELACRTLLRYTTTLLRTLKKDMLGGHLGKRDRIHEQLTAKLLLASFKTLSDRSTIEDIRQILVKMASGSVDGYDHYDEEEALAVWGELIGSLFPEAPKPDRIIDSGWEFQGNWDLPRGEDMFVFSEDECFECVKTEAGKQLDSMLGKTTELATWTEGG